MPTFTAADYLSPFYDAIPTALIPHDNLEGMSRIAAQLPGALTSFFGFECRLGDTDAASDILFAINAREMKALAGQRAEAMLPPTFWQIPAWRQVREFCRVAAAPASPLTGKIENVWLEFDMASAVAARDNVPIPSAFFGSQCLTPDAPLDWFTDCALPTLYGVHLSPNVQARVLDCIRAVPHGGMVFQTGAMMSRQPPFVRLCLVNFGSRVFGDYLTTIGWQGNRQVVEAWIQALARLVDYLALDIDVSENVGATIGLECYFNPRRSPQYEPRWYPFLEFLQARGLITDAKRQALIDFGGFVHERSFVTEGSSNGSYPQALLNASHLLGKNFYSSILRGPHHGKIVLRGDHAEAKGYFYVEHYWLRASDLKKSQSELATPKSNL